MITIDKKGNWYELALTCFTKEKMKTYPESYPENIIESIFMPKIIIKNDVLKYFFNVFTEEKCFKNRPVTEMEIEVE